MSSMTSRVTQLPEGLPLSKLLDVLPTARLRAGSSEPDGVLVCGVHHDSRAVEPGDLFVARAGAKTDGSAFITQAIARGAVALLLRAGTQAPAGIPVLEVEDVPRSLAFAADAVYGHPTAALKVVGITGTNGKTTTSQLVRACLDAQGARTGVVGTLGNRFESLDLPSAFTSPEADELARVAALMLARGATHLVMEVSSIALAAARAEAVRFAVAAFTNLTQDHLDYHGSMEAYAAAKARLFSDLGPGAAAFNVADPFGEELSRRFRATGRPLLRFSASPGASAREAEVRLLALDHRAQGLDLDVETPRGRARLRSPLLGLHNASNLLTALSIAMLLDIEPQAAADALSVSMQVPGRLERCDDRALDDVVVLVDYAHTPDALARVLESVRSLARETGGRTLCVFGCGGDRDPGKRPQMGEAVGRGADLSIVTNDNPRSEDPAAIADAILPGLRAAGATFEVELDRARAIERAVVEARPGDVVLIAGKGHEPYQIVGAQTFAFDDREHARLALASRRSRRPGHEGGAG